MKHKKTEYMHHRVKPAFKQALSDIAEELGITVTQLILDAVRAKHPQVTRLTREYIEEPLEDE